VDICPHLHPVLTGAARGRVGDGVCRSELRARAGTPALEIGWSGRVMKLMSSGFDTVRTLPGRSSDRSTLQ
jgi:hypothetical protein